MEIIPVNAIDITPNFDQLYNVFKRDVDIHSQSVTRWTDEEKVNTVRSLIVALNIMLHSVPNTEKLTEFRELFASVATKLAAHGDKLSSMETEDDDDN